MFILLWSPSRWYSYSSRGAFIGIGSKVIPQGEIGQWSIVGAGAAIVTNVEPKIVVFRRTRTQIQKSINRIKFLARSTIAMLMVTCFQIAVVEFLLDIEHLTFSF